MTTKQPNKVCETTTEHLQLWLDGVSLHGPNGECVPDFSCCRPQLAWPQEKRLRFVVACEQQDEAAQQKLLGESCAGAIRCMREADTDPVGPRTAPWTAPNENEDVS